MSTIHVDPWIADVIEDGIRLVHATYASRGVLGDEVSFASKLRWVDVADLRWLMRGEPSDEHPRAWRGNAISRVMWWRASSASARLSVAFDEPLWVSPEEQAALSVLLDHVEELLA